MAGGSDKERAKRARRAYVLYGSLWAALALAYLAARYLLAQPLRSAGEAAALLLLQAVLAWAVLASAGALGDDERALKRGGVGREAGPDYFALGAAAQLLHLWPRAASSWLLALPALVFAAHAAYSFREAIGGALALFKGAGGAAGGAAAKGGAAKGAKGGDADELGAGIGGGGGGGGGGGADGRSEEAKKKAEEKKRRHQEMLMKRMHGVRRAGMPQRRKGEEDEEGEGRQR